MPIGDGLAVGDETEDDNGLELDGVLVLALDDSPTEAGKGIGFGGDEDNGLDSFFVIPKSRSIPFFPLDPIGDEGLDDGPRFSYAVIGRFSTRQSTASCRSARLDLRD